MRDEGSARRHRALAGRAATGSRSPASSALEGSGPRDPGRDDGRERRRRGRGLGVGRLRRGRGRDRGARGARRRRASAASSRSATPTTRRSRSASPAAARSTSSSSRSTGERRRRCRDPDLRGAARRAARRAARSRWPRSPRGRTSAPSCSCGPTARTLGTLGDPDLDRVVARDALGELEAGLTSTRHYGAHGEAREDTVSVFIESFAPPPRMIIFGAVDFTAALAKVAKVLGYRVDGLRRPRRVRHACSGSRWPTRS